MIFVWSLQVTNFLWCTPNSGTTKTKLPPKNQNLNARISVSWKIRLKIDLLPTLEIFCVGMSHRFLFIRVTKSEPYLIFHHLITVSHCHFDNVVLPRTCSLSPPASKGTPLLIYYSAVKNNQNLKPMSGKSII